MFRSARVVYDQLGLPLRGLRITQRNDIPMARGLGSSSACIVAGILGANALLGGALGLVKGALLVFLAVWVLQKLQLLVTPELVNKTVLLKFFARNSPIDLIAKL